MFVYYCHSVVMKYYRYFILFHVVTIWCFLSCERLDRVVMTSHMCMAHVKTESKALLFKVWGTLESSILTSREGTGCGVERIRERGTVCN